MRNRVTQALSIVGQALASAAALSALAGSFNRNWESNVSARGIKEQIAESDRDYQYVVGLERVHFRAADRFPCQFSNSVINTHFRREYAGFSRPRFCLSRSRGFC